MDKFLPLLMLPVRLWSYGFVLARIWMWFIVPAFNVAPISQVTALGISMFLGLAIYSTDWASYNDETNSVYYKEFVMFLVPWTTLGTAWFIRLFA
jgi:hypothetical protein